MAYARSSGERVSHMPEITNSDNSQTMSLLEGYLNTNPTGIGGSHLAIVDKTAIASLPEDGGVFVDPGKSGTGQISVYVVREGDTLSEIAEMFGVSTNTIIWSNNIQRGLIKPGQELVILPISGVRHVIKKGDTLQSISKIYKADLNDILSYNEISSDAKIVAGEIIIIPDGVISNARVAVQSSNTTSNTVSSGYYIRPIGGGRKSQGIHGYNAVDLAAPIGTRIVASASGKVIVSRSGGYNGGYGTYVVISHGNGTQTLYAHMNANYLSVGQTVSQGQAVGTIGMTGRTTGPHVHFEVRGTRNPF
ncbi:MAG: M23 family metallopeptidase [Parcubacteria group bacterium]